MMREDLDLVYSPPQKKGRMKTLAKTYSQEYQSISKRTTILQPSSQFKLCLSFAIDLCLAMDV